MKHMSTAHLVENNNLQCSISSLKDVEALQLFREKATWELLKIFYVDETALPCSLAQARAFMLNPRPWKPSSFVLVCGKGIRPYLL